MKVFWYFKKRHNDQCNEIVATVYGHYFSTKLAEQIDLKLIFNKVGKTNSMGISLFKQMLI